MKRFLFIFAFVLLFSYPAYAEEIISGSGTATNRFYKHLNIEYPRLYNAERVSYTYCGDYDGAVRYLTEQAKKRQPTVSLCYYTDKSIMKETTEQTKAAIDAELAQLFDEIGNYSEFDQNGAESDYLYYQWYGKLYFSYKLDIYGINGNPIVYVTYTIPWFTTPSQVAEEDAKVTEILDELNVYDEDEYTQVKAVYDYVMDNVVYVDTSKYDPAIEEKPIYHSSYSALVMGETVCQGYATAIYRLLRELGISCRVVAGDSAGGLHAWNIVRIGSYYYLVDATWDDQSIVEYKYFLKAEYKDHFPDAEFETTEFKRFFPMAEEDYSETLEYIPNAPSNITITCDGEDAIISFDLDYTAQYACVERNGELLYLEANSLDDKTTHKLKDSPPRGDVTYEISALRAEYNSRTEEETHHYNTASSIYHKVLSIEVENTEDNTLKALLYHNDESKEGKLFVVVSRGEKTEEIYTYNPAEETEFTYENFTSDCKIKFMWIDLATMKPLSENVEFTR
ncbi:MAG: hypothetical protein J6C16_05120 [Clostridia bacterium]|nr:hypothetical protein [Clostridia bacterium]